MNNFFHEGRRKIGIVTLFLACLFAAAWVRSFSVGDFVASANYQFVSFHGGVFWERTNLPFQLRFQYVTEDDRHVTDVYHDHEWDDKWRWKRCGFAFGETETTVAAANGTFSTVKSTYYFIPYWSVVIPLTLLSASMLLSKRRKPNENPPATIS